MPGWNGNEWDNNVGKTIVNHPCVDGLYNPFMSLWWFRGWFILVSTTLNHIAVELKPPTNTIQPCHGVVVISDGDASILFAKTMGTQELKPDSEGCLNMMGTCKHIQITFFEREVRYRVFVSPPFQISLLWNLGIWDLQENLHQRIDVRKNPHGFSHSTIWVSSKLSRQPSLGFMTNPFRN